MNNTTYTQLCSNLEQLKLTQMLVHLDEITDFVTANNLSFTEGLHKLSSYEVDFKGKNASKSMIKAVDHASPLTKQHSVTRDISLNPQLLCIKSPYGVFYFQT